ncbi:type I polyketide synthase [Algoriphagus antarcticus]|uniref:Amino acid adenylation domain-containing protein n=1 Tax=Algoriphagus antarcticus TaxID=238540 RepID=A0A3E0DFC4_9BACT|nr:type I polyketide synthase [Algoriphagus antarcticus]REG81408.1 amino acid adenylation domain-containing protein [Algoriphagus antarcticus]
MENTTLINSYNSIIDMVKQSWSNFSNEIAIDNGAGKVTFKELEKRVTFLSDLILAEAANEDIIALTTTRGTQLIVNILAILNSGKTYLPIDPSFPKARIEQIVEDCGVKYYLKSKEDDSLDLQSINVNGIGVGSTSEKRKNTEIAFILYTSGSTGKPKGVCVPHSSIINLILWQAENSFSKPGVKTLQFTRVTFDISVQEIFSTLCSGGTLQMVDAEVLRDSKALIQVLNQQKVQRLFLPFVALQGIANEAENSAIYPEYLEEVMTCGEQLKSTRTVKALFAKMQKAKLFNQYGPTECTCIVTQLALPNDPSVWEDLPTIGKAISGVESLILDKDLKIIIEPNIEGEIYFSGKCLAEGYLNKPELTKKVFFPLSMDNGTTQMVYKTGDLGYYTEQKEIFFLGRIDDQVKISGFRVETGEIEAVAAELSGVEQAVVIVKEYEDLQKYLELFYVSENNQVGQRDMLAHLKKWLPSYMIPTSCIRKDRFPQTSNGKIDRKQLAQSMVNSNLFKENYIKPRGTAEVQLAEIWRELLNLDQVGREDHFFELGGTSLLAQRMAIVVSKTFGKEFTVTKIYQFPKLKDQVSFLTKNERDINESIYNNNKKNGNNRDVAVISTASRFPGAKNSEEFWEFVKNGKETIQFFDIEELAPSEQIKANSDPNYIKARGIIDDIKDFDYEFFGINPKLASIIDPQQRLFLEVAFEALDSVGYIANSPDFSIGVFAGCSTNYYYNRNLIFDQELEESMGTLQVNSANEKDYLTTRVAYSLDLKGPAVSINTACSTALVAIATAVKSIRSGECVAAIAGASSVAYPVHSGHRYEEGSILSRDGHCKPFDADASGTLFSDGGGAVLLKDYEQAIKDGDPILAIIKGVGINNDGSNKSSFSAPSVDGQAGAIRLALEDAEIDPSEIGYVEAHGTATPIGDPIEVEGLNLAFGPNVKNQYCSLGSVKGNVGHLNAAAGIAGFIKAIFALQYKTLPKSIGYSKPNPAINFEKSPFYIQQETTDWKSEVVRKAGISSFGIGGTNCHIILEEFTAPLKSITSTSEIDQTIYFSAKTENSLKEYAGRLKHFLVQNPTQNLTQFSFNVNRNNNRYKLGSAVRFKTSEELVSGLDEVLSGVKMPVIRKGEFNFPVFLFPGQGAQYVSMGKELYENEPVFRAAFSQCDTLFSSCTDFSIKALLYSSVHTEEDDANLANTRYTQPVIFAVSYSLAKLWESKGVLPSTLVGHSIGEFVAACISGVMSLEDAVQLVAKRGDLISKLSPGSMLSIRSSAEKILPLLPNDITIAADNAPNLCVVSGPTVLIESFAISLRDIEIPSKVLVTSHAFHSAMMDPALEDFKDALRNVQLSNPKIPIMSTVTGEWLKDAEATSVEYWKEHMRLPVQFKNAVNNLMNEFPEASFVEVGPGNGLSTLMMQHEEASEFIVVQSLSRNSKESELVYFQNQVQSLIGQGLRLNWDEVYPKEFQDKILLPAYAFDKKPCWIDVQLASSRIALSTVLEIVSEEIEMGESVGLNDSNSLKSTFEQKVAQIIKEACGVTLTGKDFDLSFFEIGLDSLSLTQLAFSVKKEFKLVISFLQLNTELDRPSALVEHLITQYNQGKLLNYSSGNKYKSIGVTPKSKEDSLIKEPIKSLSNAESNTTLHNSGESGEQREVQDSIMSLNAETFIKDLIQSYHIKTASSRKLSQEKLAFSSDSDLDCDLSQAIFELNYPIVSSYSKGAHLRDLDGNEYLDWFSGLGNNVFGHQPEFIEKAITDFMQKRSENDSQTNWAEILSRKIGHLTQNDQVELFDSGSEAILGALGIARTVSQKKLVVILADNYLDEIDQTIKTSKSQPTITEWDAHPNSSEVLVLGYGTNESLEIIADRFDEIAAVLVTPVQANRPEFIPIDYLKDLRSITTELSICLIFDELNTGFRSHIGGFQALYSIYADLSIYGEVLGGGFSIGVLAGKSDWMDSISKRRLLGEKSRGLIEKPFITGLTGRHPLQLVAANAVVDYLSEKGDNLQETLTDLTNKIVIGLNSIFAEYNVDYYAVNFCSSWKIKLKENFENSGLLFTLLLERGIYILQDLMCYTTEVHTKADVIFTLSEVEKIVRLLVENEVIKGDLLFSPEEWMSSENPPFKGAKISIDENGIPVWVTSDEYKKTRNIILQSFFL